MNEYRVYLLGRDNKITGAFSIEAPSVQSAIATARQGSDAALEIWEGPKRLATVILGASSSPADLAL